MTSGDWAVSHVSGSPAHLHALPIPEPVARSVWVFEATVSTVALGSAQQRSILDDAAVAHRGLEVTQRASGGGAVLIEPGGLVWVDVLLPTGDELWHSDVGRASWWLGEVWAEALARLGVSAAVHHGPLLASAWSALVCFGGLGSGEVTVDGAKVVGISQRRTRYGARFQCAALCRWEPERLVDVLALSRAQRHDAVADLAPRAIGLTELVPSTSPEALRASVLDAFVAVLRQESDSRR